MAIRERRIETLGAFDNLLLLHTSLYSHPLDDELEPGLLTSRLRYFDPNVEVPSNFFSSCNFFVTVPQEEAHPPLPKILMKSKYAFFEAKSALFLEDKKSFIIGL